MALLRRAGGLRRGRQRWAAIRPEHQSSLSSQPDIVGLATHIPVGNGGYHRLDAATRPELEEFGRAAWVGEIPDGERARLLDAILPPAPAADEVNRVATYAVLLALAELHEDPRFGEAALFAEAGSADRRTSAELDRILDGLLPRRRPPVCQGRQEERRGKRRIAVFRRVRRSTGSEE